MKHNLLNELMPSDKTMVVLGLEASLEAIWKMDAEERARTEISNDLVQLGLKVRRDFPEDHPLSKAISDALQIASVGLDSNIPSMEGLGDVFGRLIGREKKPVMSDADMNNRNSTEYRKAIKAFVEEMKKTYLNEQWLNKQSFVTSPISAKDIGRHFEIDGKEATNPLGNFEIVKERLTKFFSAWSSQYLKASEAVMKIHSKLIKEGTGAKPGDERVLGLVKEAIAEIDKIPDPIKNFPKFDETSFENVIPYVNKEEVDVKQSKAPREVNEMQPLDKDGVGKAARLIVDIVSLSYFPCLPSGKWLDYDSEEDNLSDWIRATDKSLFDQYYGRFYIGNAAERYEDFSASMVDNRKLVSALIRLIDRSIK